MISNNNIEEKNDNHSSNLKRKDSFSEYYSGYDLNSNDGLEDNSKYKSNLKRKNSIPEYDAGYGSDFEYDEKSNMIKHKKPKISHEIEYNNSTFNPKSKS